MTSHHNNPSSQNTEEWFYLSLHDITGSLNVSTETIIEIINEGIITIESNNQNEWQFDAIAFRRIRQVLRLTSDLGINLAGAGLALELLEEIERLNRQLQRLT